MGGDLAPQTPPPVIRQDLTLAEAEADPDGSPAWVLYDPLANRYYRLGQTDVELLAYIGQGDHETIAAQASADLNKPINPQHVADFFDLLRKNNLVMGDATQQKWFDKQNEMKQQNAWLGKLAKSYLFFRIPFWRPDKFLGNTLPYVRWLGSRWFQQLLLVLMVVGLLRVVQQFDVFMATFIHFFNISGIAFYIAILFFVKIFHELGHAYVAKSMGVKVPVIGVAFLVGWPVFYTDTSDAWRLPSRRKRMIIASAGIRVELAIAIISLFLWSMAPEGIVRSALFILATTSWLLSVLVNINPLMRFDGYYLLSDMIHTPNLEPRATALGKWWLRERLFGWGAEAPETPRGILILFAYAVWTYRLFLFLGIAMLVYFFFFKTLGVILFLIEIVYFILMPIFRELKQWYKKRELFHLNFALARTGLLVVTAVLLFFIPWSTTITAPAIMQHQYHAVYVPVSGAIESILKSNNDEVKQGDSLFNIQSAALVHEMKQAQRRHDEYKWNRAALGFNPKLLKESLIVSSQLQTQHERLNSLKTSLKRLNIRAEYRGTIVDRNQDYQPGDWISEGERILSIKNSNMVELIAYIEEDTLLRVSESTQARFYPEAASWSPIDATLDKIETADIQQLDRLYQASLMGGDLAVREDEDGMLTPVSSTYIARFRPSAAVNEIPRVIRGTIRIQSHAESYATRIWRQVVAVWHREAGV